MRTYTTTFPDFFTVFIAQIRSSSNSAPSTPHARGGQSLNPRLIDLLLRILHEIAMELSDAILRGNKSQERLAIDAALRDNVRAKDAPLIAKTPMGNPWIDINLMVTPTTVPLIHNCIYPSFATSTHPYYPIRTAAADALIETVSKGMPSGDKVELINVLQLPELLNSLVAIGRENGASEGEESLEVFREKLAKLLSSIGSQLFLIFDDSTAAAETKTAALNLMNPLLPLLLTFLGDVHDDTSAAVIPFALGVIGYYKKEKKANQQARVRDEGAKAFLTQLLSEVMKKMEHGVDADWSLDSGDDVDEDHAKFLELRKGLKQLFDGIAAIDDNLFGNTVYAFVLSVLETLQSTPSTVTWQLAELAIYVLYIYGEASKGTAITIYSKSSTDYFLTAATGQAGFVVIPESVLRQQQSRSKTQTSNQQPAELDHSQYPLSPLGEMMYRVIKSNIVAFPHSSVALQFFECVVRYHEFFKLSPDCIGDVLPSFMDERGLHQPDMAVRCRIYYLFNRFIFNSKSIIQSQVSGQLISDILSRMQDIMIIRAELPQAESPQEDILTKATRTASPFDAQLYLFETMGTLISVLNQIPEQQVILLRAGFAPLLSDLESNIRTSISSPADVVAILQLHHVIMAIGNVAKGFPDVSPRNLEPTGEWIQVFKEATDRILAVLKVMSGIAVIREASRFAFNRIVTTAGSSVLPLIPTLIDCLINQVTLTELAEFTSFLGNVIHKYKAHVLGVLDNLILPLFQRVVYFLNQPINGTDDKVQQSELRRAQFGLINMIINSHLHEVFVSPTNRPQFEEILKTTIHFISTNSLPPDQKQGFLVLRNFTTIWVEPISPEAEENSKSITKFNNTKALPTSTPIPGLHNFFYEHAVPVAVGLPKRMAADYSDAGTYDVIGEIYFFLRQLFLKRGEEVSQLLLTRVLPAAGFTPDQAKEFVQNVTQNKEYRKFKTYYSDFCKANKPPFNPHTS
ncbi:hypothetical protein BT69DRAFT_1314090 [Atractiella rhizophila]|nr:hypothetical protein BT69DRAFT_1314090 [Atractiella rhizophila]